jgi:hypothetical protein
MGGAFGGGGGSAPTAPTLKQVDTSLTGDLYKTSSQIGDEWANLMRGSYGLGQSTGPATPWMQPLGHGALAMMGQANLPWEGKQDPQVVGTLGKAFGPGAVGALGEGVWQNPFLMARQLGEAPLTELQRNQQFTSSLANQWKPPDLRLTGTDLLNVKMQQMTQNAQAQQAAFEAALQGSSAASAAQSAAQSAAISGIGKVAGAGIQGFFGNSPSLNSTGYYQTPLGLAFSPGGTPGGTGGTDYSAPPTDVNPGGGLVSNTSGFGS